MMCCMTLISPPNLGDIEYVRVKELTTGHHVGHMFRNISKRRLDIILGYINTAIIENVTYILYYATDLI
jgi:hypothetical protein